MQAAAPKKTKATPKAAPKANAAEAAIIDSEQIPLSSAAQAAIVEQALPTAPTASAEAAMNEANGHLDGWDGWM